jgi:hypothetical protein
MNGGPRPPNPLFMLPLILLVLAFVLSLGKKPVGRWIGILPLVPFLIFALMVSQSAGDGFAQLRWGLGIYFSLLASLAASVIGFAGRVFPGNKNLAAQNPTHSAWGTLPLNPEDPGAIQKLLSGRMLMAVSIILLAVNFLAGFFQGNSFADLISIVSMLTAIVIGIVAYLRISTVLQHEISTRIVVSILIALPLANLITLIVLAVKISGYLKSVGCQAGIFGAQMAQISQKETP